MAKKEPVIRDTGAGKRAAEKVKRDEEILRKAAEKETAEDRQNALIEQLKRDTH